MIVPMINQAKNQLVQVAVQTPLRRYFDYLLPDHIPAETLKPGMRLRVPFQRRELIGIYIRTIPASAVPQHKLKSVIECLDHDAIIPTDILELCQWAADYYHDSIGEVLLGSIPAWLRQGKSIEVSLKKILTIPTQLKPPLSLNAEQQFAVNAIKLSQTFKVYLLEGVTGSGKTEVYLQTIAKVLEGGAQAMVLVPEIGLTPQTIQRFRERFSAPVGVLHSSMTEKQRFQAWLAAKTGAIKILIGTRSAVFTPFANLGLIVIDEEHDLSFKQQDGFRYHARDVAIMRAHFKQIPIILGSATPSLETFHNAQQGRYEHLPLRKRAGNAQLPELQILDIRNTHLDQGLSPTLLHEMQLHLEKGDQVMLFLNRRGFAPVLACPSCGWMAQCKRCDTRMTYHYKAQRLHCHHCDAQKNLMTKCEACGEKELFAMGQGTERIEKVLTQYFSKYSIARIDRDSMRGVGAMEKVLEKIQNREHHILVGTQMLAKGHHFPHVTLVVIVDADNGFFSTDFRALERMGQLLLQVAGRAGRHEKPGKVLIQTRHPDHPLLHQLLHKDYQTFSSSLLNERMQAELPPFAFFALFRAEAHQFEHAEDFLQQIKNKIDGKNKSVQIMGPLSAPMSRRKGKYRVQLLLQAKQRSALQSLLKDVMQFVESIPLKRVRWSLDIDPLEMT